MIYMKKFLVSVMIIGVFFSSFLFQNGDAEDNVAQLTTVSSKVADSTSLPGGIQTRVSLDLRNIEVVDALKFLAIKAKMNIITTKDVAGRITLMVEDVPVKDIFDIMLRSNDLAYRKEGDIYNVMTEEKYKALFGRRFSDIRQVKVFRIQYAIPEQVFSLLDTLKSDIGRVLVEPDSGTALIMDTPEKIKDIEKALLTLEQKNLVQVFTLKYAKAKEAAEQLKTQLDLKKVGTITADERSNQLIIQALPDRMRDIERLVLALDVKTKAVLIDAKIIKVKLSDQLDKGIEWEGLMNISQSMGMTYVGSYPYSVLQPATENWQARQEFLDTRYPTAGVGSYPFSGNTPSSSSSSKVAPGEKLHVGVVGKRKDLDAVLKYLQTLGKTQVLSNPKLAVINNQEARIHVGEKQAYVTTTTTTGQTTTTVSEEVTFVDVGIQLSVTPTINDDGFITMKVKPEISSVVSTLTTPSGNKIPIIDSSMAETTVLVKDGATIVLGGLRKEEKVLSSEQVPFLGNIPLLGALFKSSTNKTERTELMVMITPHIVSGAELTTGDERDFGERPGKEYREYPGLTSQSDYKPEKEEPKDKIRTYKEYPELKQQKEEESKLKEGYVKEYKQLEFPQEKEPEAAEPPLGSEEMPGENTLHEEKPKILRSIESGTQIAPEVQPEGENKEIPSVSLKEDIDKEKTPSLEIKPYHEYTELKEQKEEDMKIKGDNANE
ncbi:MAG: secretin N-terminal domain-containing protein [Candidatus Omnitrophota bacterium]